MLEKAQGMWPSYAPLGYLNAAGTEGKRMVRAKELRENLYAARKKPVRTAIGGQLWILKVGVYDSFGEDAFRVRIDPAPKLDPSDQRAREAW